MRPAETETKDLPDLRDEVAIVTGAGRGVGRAIAETLARAGARVVLTARTRSELDSTATSIQDAGGRALAAPADVSDERALAGVVTETVRLFGRPTLLVNAAGVWKGVGPIEHTDPAIWWSDIEVNLRGTFLCTKLALAPMLEARSGRIVNVASYAGIKPRPFASGYAASKAAVIQLSESLAAELEGRGIRVFVITPGFVRTRLVEEVAASSAGRRYLPELASRNDALEPEQAGLLVADIASGRLDALSGRFIHVLDDVDQMLRRLDEIQERDLYTLRLMT